MSRHSFGASMRMIAREVARAERAKARQAAATLRELRNLERQAKADAIAAQIEEAEDLTRAIQDREKAIGNLLACGLGKNPMIDPATMMQSYTPKRFDETPWKLVGPNKDEFIPAAPGFFARLLPGSTGRHQRRVREDSRRFDAAEAYYRERLAARSAAVAAFESSENDRKAEIDRQNATVHELQRGLEKKEHSAVVSYFKLVIDRSLEGEPDAVSAEVGYAPDSSHLVVDLELPELSTVPDEIGFRYIKSSNRIDPIARPVGRRKALYANLLCQVALKCIDTIFRGDPTHAVECLTLNGMLDTIDPATGQQVRVCLLSVRITADAFRVLNLGQVQPEHCLRSLKASVSRAPAELLPVKPLIELDMVDPRFVATL